jgi:uncharacterized protein YyaL (SSP411 family)
MNRLARETSPYLLQHAHNPVDWWPWGPEAFAEARRRNVPIFLSIGYSTCYWCHVMERESFESAAIARQMNGLFVNIKVDREERPDVDDVYMAATQILSGRGGWPMSAFLEPHSLRPFWCGTYFPPEPKMGMPGFPQILEALAKAWRERPAEVTEQAESVAAAVREQLALAQSPVGLSLDQVSQGAASLLRMLDRIHGGFGGAPKFPQPVFLELLLDVRENAGDDATRSAIDQAVKLTLDKMALGGIHDQVGGGFHRYSVDEKWLVPHFEKMLYDNAQLASLYARAASIYSDDFYRRTADRTLRYILAEMTGPQGEFYSAQDAEVNGREGANYIWTGDQLRAALPPDEAAFAARVYGVEDGPNFRDPHHPQEAASVLYLKSRPDAATLGQLDRINPILYAARAKRPQPRLDDKTITAWNGMMIAALARAAVWLDEPAYAKAAARAADFILSKLTTADGQLLRTYRAAQAKTDAFLEDYAFLAEGLLALVAAQGRGLLPRETDYGARGQRLAATAESLFTDAASGGYFDTRESGGAQTDLFVRPRSGHDGAIPGAASTTLHALVTLYELTGEAGHRRRALDCLRSLSSAIAQSPVAAANATRALLRLATSSRAVAEQIAGFGPAPAAEAPAPESPVEIFAEAERVEIGKDHPAQFKLVLRIREGYHLNAAEPGDESLIPLRVGIAGGAGVAVYADYPPGEPYGPDGAARVYKGSVEFNIALERAGDWSGRPILTVRFQACTNTECLPPMTAELDVAIDALD